MSILDVKDAKILGDGSLNSCCTSKKRNVKPISYAAAGSICLVRLRYSSKLQQIKRVVYSASTHRLCSLLCKVLPLKMVTLFVVMSCSSQLYPDRYLERILWASPGFTEIKDRFLTWFVHSTFHYPRFDISTLFKRPRMFCLATNTVLINCVSVKLGLSCETFLFSSVLWLLCAIRDLHLPVTCRRRFLRLQLCKLQLQHGWEHAGAARLLSESKVYCLSFVKTCLNWLCSANWIAPKQLRIVCR